MPPLSRIVFYVTTCLFEALILIQYEKKLETYSEIVHVYFKILALLTIFWVS